MGRSLDLRGRQRPAPSVLGCSSIKLPLKRFGKDIPRHFSNRFPLSRKQFETLSRSLCRQLRMLYARHESGTVSAGLRGRFDASNVLPWKGDEHVQKIAPDDRRGRHGRLGAGRRPSLRPGSERLRSGSSCLHLERALSWRSDRLCVGNQRSLGVGARLLHIRRHVQSQWRPRRRPCRI
ncbi:protein of unknown function [Methylocella tundrae]|uniref:Uncharacterized protein n=1 Tax=Methylocella tundrae TaxID=227605 RepID=A0A4U8YU06_METTU|nr:protein of unknown function [Methylocella tundrae]